MGGCLEVIGEAGEDYDEERCEGTRNNVRRRGRRLQSQMPVDGICRGVSGQLGPPECVDLTTSWQVARSGATGSENKRIVLL